MRMELSGPTGVLEITMLQTSSQSCWKRDCSPCMHIDLVTGYGMNFEETIVGKLTEAYQTVHLKEFTDFPKKDEKDPTEVFTDIHFEKKSVAHEAYHLSHGSYQ